MRGRRRCLAICCLVTLVIIILLVVTLVILYFTVFKPKKPQVVTTPVDLRDISFSLSPNLTLDISLGMHVFVKNPNYGGFKYDNTTTFIYYRGMLVGEAPIESGEIDARSTEKIDTVADIQAAKIILSPYFLPDIYSGSLNLTTSSTMDGDVIVLNIFKLHASSQISCDISVFVWTRSISSSCIATIKI